MNGRQIILNALAFLFAGAIINVIVAWALAYWIAPLDHGSTLQCWIPDQNLRNASEWVVIRREWIGMSHVTAMPGSGTRYTAAGATPTVIVTDATLMFPTWCTLRELMTRRAIEQQTTKAPRALIFIADGRGWPCVALTCHWDFTAATTSQRGLQNGFAMKPYTTALGGPGCIDDERALPYGIVWTGFVTNTLFYAAIAWMLTLGPSQLRRHRRRKRGLCVRCGYPIGSNDVCTECGRQIDQARASRA